MKRNIIKTTIITSLILTVSPKYIYAAEPDFNFNNSSSGYHEYNTSRKDPIIFEDIQAGTANIEGYHPYGIYNKPLNKSASFGNNANGYTISQSQNTDNIFPSNLLDTENHTYNELAGLMTDYLYKKPSDNRLIYFSGSNGPAKSICVSPRNHGSAIIDLNTKKSASLLTDMHGIYILNKALFTSNVTEKSIYTYINRIYTVTGVQANPYLFPYNGQLGDDDYEDAYGYYLREDALESSFAQNLYDNMYSLAESFSKKKVSRSIPTTYENYALELPVVLTDDVLKPTEVVEDEETRTKTYLFDITDLSKSTGFENGALQPPTSLGNEDIFNEESRIMNLIPSGKDTYGIQTNIKYPEELGESTSIFSLTIPSDFVSNNYSKPSSNIIRLYQKYDHNILGLQTDIADDYSNYMPMLHPPSLSQNDSQAVAQSSEIYLPIKILLDDPEEIPEPDPEPEPPVTTGKNDLQWNNIPLSFGELKQGSYSSLRETEEYEVMNGVPTTSNLTKTELYYNGGATEGVIDAEYEMIEKDITYKLKVVSSSKCVGHSVPDKKVEYINDDGTYDFEYVPQPDYYDPNHNDTKTQEKEYKHEIKFLSMKGLAAAVPTAQFVSHPYIDTFSLINSSRADKLHRNFKVNNKNNNEGYEDKFGTISDNVHYGGENSSETVYTYTAETVECDGKSKASREAIDWTSVQENDLSTAIGEGNTELGDLFVRNDTSEIQVGGKTYHIVSDEKEQTIEPFGNEEPLIETDETLFIPTEDDWDPLNHIPIVGYEGDPKSTNRNKGTPFIKEDLTFKEFDMLNGLYSFEDYKTSNYTLYDFKSIKEGEEEVSSTGHGKSVEDSSNHKLNDVKIQTEYLDWQSGNLQKPTKISINPFIIHNPISNQYSWISDTSDNILFDQRIDKNENDFTKRHINSLDPQAPTRLYIDQAFEVTIPNKGSFNKYWGNSKSPSEEKGLYDYDQTITGQLGNGYYGESQDKELKRNSLNPYNTLSQMDTSEWINAKYIRFPFDVIYYKDKDTSNYTFHTKNTWIELYNDNKSLNSNDPQDFRFTVQSHVKDMANQRIDILIESFNSPYIGNPDQQWDEAEEYSNGKRDKSYINTESHSASSSVRNSFYVDVIGRIGNLVYSSSTDPAYINNFWHLDNKGNIDLTRPKQNGYFGTKYNIFQSPAGTVNYIDRYLNANYLKGNGPSKTLPIIKTSNQTADKTNQDIKLGYNNYLSVQTIGNYNSINIQPKYRLEGEGWDLNTDDFKLYATDENINSKKLLEYYDSQTTNVFEYNPQLKYDLSLSLLNPLLKLSNYEKQSQQYLDAKDKGSMYSVNIGTLTNLVIPQELSTNIGDVKSSGELGVKYPSTRISNQQSSNSTSEVISNIKKWYFNINKPTTTKVVIDNDIIERTKDQYIDTDIQVRAKGEEWDLILSKESSDNLITNNEIITGTNTLMPINREDYSNPKSKDYDNIGTQ